MGSLTVSVGRYAEYASSLVLDKRTMKPDPFVSALMDWLKDEMTTRLGLLPWTSADFTGATSASLKKGSFLHREWKLRITQPASTKEIGFLSTADPKLLQEYVDTVMHEAYHCEQYYTVARALAKAGTSQVQIENQLHLPWSVRDRAVKIRMDISLMYEASTLPGGSATIYSSGSPAAANPARRTGIGKAAPRSPPNRYPEGDPHG